MRRSFPNRAAPSLPFLVASVVLGIVPVASAQGDTGFLRGDGRTDIALGYSQEKFEHFWVGDHKMSDPGIGKVYRDSYNLWVAHGLTEDLDLIGSASIVRADAKGTANLRDHAHLQDGVFGAKWRFVNERLGPGAFSLLATPAVKIPLSHYESNEVTAIGDGQVDLRLRGVAHYQLDSGVFAAVEAGYDVRFENTPSEFPISVTVGATLFERLTVAPFMTWVDSQGDDDIGQVDFPDVEEDATRGGVAGYLRLNDRYGLSAGYKTTFQGRNTGDSWSWWWALVIRF